ncbi:MAG: DUF4270 domain-containing protein [bacterium]|nr:DUF4270 domain-containing protein [bacterium]
MNLLDKKWLGLVLPLALTIFSCDEENQIGQEIDNSSNRLDIQYQEFTLPSANIFIDSVRTDADVFLLSGNFSDEFFGEIHAEGYANYNSTSAALPDSSAVLDSAVLSLKFNKFYGDFPETQTFVVYEIADTLYDDVVYTSNRRATLQNEIGRITDNFDPQFDTALHINLDQTFAQELFQKLVNMESFTPFSNGENRPIALVPEGGDALYGFDLTDLESAITLHYKQDDDTLQYAFDFNEDANYNAISSDKSSSPLSFLEPTGVQKFDVDPNLVHMNPATGILPWVDLNGVYDYFEGIDNANVISARLEFPIDPSDTAEYFEYSVTLTYYFANNDGSFNGSGALLNSFNNILLTDQSYLTGQPEIAVTQITDETFSFERDVTLFTQLLITNEINNEKDPAFPESLVILPASASSINQTAFFKNGIKLKVHYTVPN